MLTGSELWLLRLMADRGLALLDASNVLLLLEEKGELRVAGASGGPVGLRVTKVHGSALGALYASGRPLAMDRPRGEDAAFLHELGLQARSVLVAPFSMAEQQGGGLAIALRREGSFSRRDRDALTELADNVAARLAAERSVEVERLRYGMEARERERRRWAREIHDESVQGLGAIRMQLANARDDRDGDRLARAVDGALEGLGNEIDGLRHLITELRPAALDDLGLAAALEALARRAQALDGLDVRTEFAFARDEPTGPGEARQDSDRLDPELESTIYRVVQEALTNVGRHAEATRAVIGLTADEEQVVVSVTDDGRGMPDLAELGPRADMGGFGTGGMRERAELVAGELEWLPAPVKGTTVRLTVPLSGRPRPGQAAAAQGAG